MITEERRAEIVLEIQKESISLEMVRGLNLEELLFFIRTLQGADGGVDQVLIDQLISKAKGYDSWYIVNFKEFPVPFIRGGKAYIFTDEDAGKTAVERFEKRGLPVELYRHPLYAEDIFERIIRYGAEGVSINRGGLGLILNADLFSSDIEWSGKELNLAIIELILSVNEEDEAQEKAEKVFSDALRMAELYYAAAQTNNPRNADPMIEKSYSEGREHDCVLVDESGSTRGELIKAAMVASAVVEDFCRELEIPHLIYGFSTYGNGPLIISYSEPHEIDGGNRYRITGMTDRDGTPTAEALAYIAKQMRGLQVDISLLIVVTDGQSKSTIRTKEVVRSLLKQKMILVAAGIGKNRTQVEKEFGERFIDISNVDLLADQLIAIIKENLWV